MGIKPSALLNCLIVTGDASAYSAITAELRDLNLRFRNAENAEAALDDRSFDPDLLISEFRLQGASGIELVASLHDRGSFPLTALLADSPSFEDGQAAWKLGVSDVLPGPLDLAALRSTVESLLVQAATHVELPETLNTTAPATLVGAGTLVRESIAFAMRHGAGPAARARLGGAVFELADNARMHAYKNESGEIRLSMQIVDGDELRIRISDQGTGFDAVRARLDAVPSPLEPNAPLPQGLMRVSALVEGFKIQSSPRGTVIDMVVGFGLATFEAEFGNDFSDLDYFDTSTAKRVLGALQRESENSIFSIPPSLAVVIGRLLAGSTGTQVAHATLWS